jgi:hypothetical protein
MIIVSWPESVDKRLSSAKGWLRKLMKPDYRHDALVLQLSGNAVSSKALVIDAPAFNNSQIYRLTRGRKSFFCHRSRSEGERGGPYFKSPLDL